MSAGEELVRGTALLGPELEVRGVTLVIRGGVIAAVEEETVEGGPWICPAFFNAHTHLGDTVAMDIPAGGSLEQLVTPPDGLKHRILAATPPGRLIEGMRASISTMQASGTGGFADFREGGVLGVGQLRVASEGFPGKVFIFGREGGEQVADGLGVSSSRDLPDLETIVAGAKAAKKKVAFHAGERDPLDVEAALSYDPDLLIHCTHATPSQLRECADRGIPIAICARSNWRLGVTRSDDSPPLELMEKLGCTLMLGTDNAMFVQPDMWREMEFVSRIYHLRPEKILSAAMRGSAEFDTPYFIGKGNKARFFVIDPASSNLRFSHDVFTTLVNRAGSNDIVKKVFYS
jgi:cytosine/adenosine deaminase-related metal-dependent hydrolase